MEFPNVERRDEGPRLSRQQAEEERYAEIERIERENYERLLGEAGSAIRALPYDMVTNETIASLVNNVSAKANQAKLYKTVELLDILESEIS